MRNNMGVAFAGLFLVLVVLLITGGCRSGDEDFDTEVKDEQEISIQGQGIYVGQIDSQSVEIEIEGDPGAFGLAEGLNVSEIESGSRVSFTYEEQEERPVLKSIEVLDEPAEEVFQGTGLYVGRIDSRSVEIKSEGEYRAFAIDREATIEGLIDGSTIAFSYTKGEHRPVLLAVEVIEEPDHDDFNDNQEIDGEGIFVGQIDSQSIEVVRNRAFSIGEGVDLKEIPDGVKVAFTYTETGDRPIIDSIEAVDSPPEGVVTLGIFIGQIDSHSLEIEYEQAFTLGEGINVEGIESGAVISFTYREGPARPVIISLSGL